MPRQVVCDAALDRCVVLMMMRVCKMQNEDEVTRVVEHCLRPRRMDTGLVKLW